MTPVQTALRGYFCNASQKECNSSDQMLSEIKYDGIEVVVDRLLARIYGRSYGPAKNLAVIGLNGNDRFGGDKSFAQDWSLFLGDGQELSGRHGCGSTALCCRLARACCFPVDKDL